MKKRTPWNKGKTKYDHPSVASMATKMKSIDNLAKWRKENQKRQYPSLKKSEQLAELYGTILGDGYIFRFPRTERLIISFNSKEKDHIKHIAKIINKLFDKHPTVITRNSCNCTDISLYQKYLSKRLHFPIGRKLNHKLRIPEWIRAKNSFLLKCLKGLYESDGYWHIDPKYNTNVMGFVNRSQSLLRDVHKSVEALGFHPWISSEVKVILSKRAETKKFAKLIKFRQYD